MLSKILTLGDKIELESIINSNKKTEEEEKKKIYISQVYDVLEDGKIAIAMPIVEGRIIPLSVNTHYDACFYTKNGLYQARLVIVERYKENGLHTLVVEFVSELKKFQRRQFYRLPCTMNVEYKRLDQEEVDEYMGKAQVIDIEGSFQNGIVLDLSGGGMRFLTKEKMDTGDIIIISLQLQNDEEAPKTLLIGKVILSEEIKNREKVYENRMEFIEISERLREKLVKFIFEEERKQRRKENGE